MVVGLRLVPDGIELKEWVPPDDILGTDGHYDVHVESPQRFEELFPLWYQVLDEIDPAYTLGHFFSLIAGMASGTRLAGCVPQHHAGVAGRLGAMARRVPFTTIRRSHRLPCAVGALYLRRKVHEILTVVVVVRHRMCARVGAGVAGQVGRERVSRRARLPLLDQRPLGVGDDLLRARHAAGDRFAREGSRRAGEHGIIFAEKGQWVIRLRNYARAYVRVISRTKPSDLAYLEVYNTVELTEYVEDPNRPDEPLRFLTEDEVVEQDAQDAAIAAATDGKKPFRIVDATGDEPRRMRIPEMHGKWTAPYHLSRDFHAWGKQEEWGGTPGEIVPYSISFIPVQNMLALPLRYNPKVQFTNEKYGDAHSVVLDTELTITLGECIRAVLWEIGWHGAPEDRDARGAELREKKAELDRELGEP